jgi:hypothetical protein
LPDASGRRPSVLLVLPEQEDLSADGRPPRFSGALPLVFEKHGHLAVETAGPSALSDPATYERHAVVVVAAQPPAVWTGAAQDALLAGSGHVVLEAPLPERVRTVLGVTAVVPQKPETTITVGDERLRERCALYGVAPGGRMAPATYKPVDRDSRLDWAALPGVPLPAEVAAAWRQVSWTAEQWTVAGDVEILAAGRRSAKKDPYPAVVRRGRLTGIAVGLLEYVGRLQTSEPSLGGDWPSSPRGVGLEILVMGLVDMAFAEAGLARLRIRPWPHGARWAMSVRHDVDRPITMREVQELLAAHRRVGSAATWYWRARHVTAPPRRLMPRRSLRRPASPLLAVAATPGHEVALHSEKLYVDGDDERRTVEGQLGAPVAGGGAPGPPDCFRYQGAPNVLWAHGEGLLYTELIQHAHFHPHRFATLRQDGVAVFDRPLCLPHHVSFDRGMKRGQTYAAEVLGQAETLRAAGGFFQLMNHPDLHRAELFETLASIPTHDCFVATAQCVADWWMRSHTGVHASADPSGSWSVAADQPVAGLTFEVLAPNGYATTVETDLEPGRQLAVSDQGAVATVA